MNDSVTDIPGDVNPAPDKRGSEATQVVPEDAHEGQLGVGDNAQPKASTGVVRIKEWIDAILVPQPKVDGTIPTPEQVFATDSDDVSTLHDILRYIMTDSLRVIDTPSRHIKFVRQVATTTPKRLLGWQPNRKRVQIKTVGNDIYLGDAMVTADTGYLHTTTDGVLEIQAQAEIYALSAAGEATIYIITELYE